MSIVMLIHVHLRSRIRAPSPAATWSLRAPTVPRVTTVGHFDSADRCFLGESLGDLHIPRSVAKSLCAGRPKRLPVNSSVAAELRRSHPTRQRATRRVWPSRRTRRRAVPPHLSPVLGTPPSAPHRPKQGLLPQCRPHLGSPCARSCGEICGLRPLGPLCAAPRGGATTRSSCGDCFPVRHRRMSESPKECSRQGICRT